MEYTDSDIQMNTELILCIEEVDMTNFQSPVDTRLFIGWCSDREEFFVRGKREDAGVFNFAPFAFQCESASDLYDFIEFTFSKSNCNIVLYNYNNTIGMSYDDLTYEFFESLMDRNYEIAGYDDVHLKRSKIVKYLRMLKNVNYE